MASKRILVTGANRGIGNAILHALARTYPQHTYVLAARTLESIEPAIAALRATGITAPIDPLELDVTSDASIGAAATALTARYGSLDVLVNNAGVAEIPAPDAPLTTHRAAWTRVLDTNVAGVANTTRALLPLLRAAAATPMVINVSSGRASIARSVGGGLPPTQSVAYSVSKLALNGLTIEMGKAEADVRFYCVSPGHCKTQLNSFRGLRDPMEGANVVVGLVRQAGAIENGFYETVGDKLELQVVPW